MVQFHAKVKFDYDAPKREKGVISLKVDETVEVLETRTGQEGWWFGIKEDGYVDGSPPPPPLVLSRLMESMPLAVGPFPACHPGC